MPFSCPLLLPPPSYTSSTLRSPGVPRPELGLYNSPNTITPNLDAIASKGTVFTNAYCQQPVCSPSRNSFMTSLRPDSTGAWNFINYFRQKHPDAVSFPEFFKKQPGYVRVRAVRAWVCVRDCVVVYFCVCVVNTSAPAYCVRVLSCCHHLERLDHLMHARTLPFLPRSNAITFMMTDKQLSCAGLW